jgi:hypothetical protein
MTTHDCVAIHHIVINVAGQTRGVMIRFIPPDNPDKLFGTHTLPQIPRTENVTQVISFVNKEGRDMVRIHFTDNGTEKMVDIPLRN